jgi:hypothetical protein
MIPRVCLGAKVLGRVHEASWFATSVLIGREALAVRPPRLSPPMRVGLVDAGAVGGGGGGGGCHSVSQSVILHRLLAPHAAQVRSSLFSDN